MVAKTVKVAFTNTGLDKLMSSMEKLSEQTSELRDGVDIPIHLLDDGETQAKLDALAARVAEINGGDGASLDVSLLGSDEALEGLDAGTVALDEYNKASIETTESLERLTVAQESYGAGSAEVIAAQDEFTAATLRSMDAQLRLGEVDLSTSAKTKASADSQDALAEKTEASSSAFAGMGSKLGMIGIGLAVVSGVSLKMAGNFDAMATTLVTGAGESEKNLDMVKSGMLAISAQTATSVDEVESGMYLIESAGFHGAEGLKVLAAAAQGAKVGNASLADVANAVTSALNAYHLSGSHAVAITNALIATTAAGKMHMDDLAKSLGNVLPIAASAHISFSQVGGALATMTMQGMTTRRASMNLANAIRSLVSPSATASAEMADLGLNANTISKNLGKVGLTGTLDELTEAILRNQKGGSILASSFDQMAGPAKALAEEILKGSISSGALTNAEKALSPMQAALVAQFDKSATSATGLKQTFDSAMKTMMGGATGLNVALLLGGQNASVFSKNVGSVNAALDGTGKTVTGFNLVQKDLNFQMDQAKVSAKDTAISFGEALMPAVTTLMGPISHFAEVIAESSAASKIFAGIVVTVLAVALGTKLVQGFQAVGSAASATWGLITKLVPALGAETVATEGAETAQEGLNLAFMANPIGLIITGLVLLGVAFYELTTHCKAFRDFWVDTWKLMEDAAQATWSWLKNNWEVLVAALLSIATAGMSLVALEVYKHWSDIENYTDDLRHDLASIWDGIGSDIDGIWDTVWDNTIGRLTRGIQDAENRLSQFKGWLGSFFGNAGSWLVSAGEDLIHGLYAGADNVIHDVGSWVSGIGHDIVSAVESFFGIHSPSTVFAGIGGNLMLGLLKGMIAHNPVDFITKILGSMPNAIMDILGKGFLNITQLPGELLTKLFGIGGHVASDVSGFAKGVWNSLFGGGGGGGAGAGVTQWAGVIQSALAMLGQPLSLLGDVEHRMNQESGGNDTVVNKWDSNWAAGTPSVGLMQVIGPTFDAYAGPFKTVGPFEYGTSVNPLANVYAGLNYALHAYGSIASAMMKSGGYAKGGIINEPMFAMGASGNGLWLGEQGPEAVVPLTGGYSPRGGGGNNIIINIGVATDPDATAASIHKMLRRYKGKRGGMSLGLS